MQHLPRPAQCGLLFSLAAAVSGLALQGGTAAAETPAPFLRIPPRVAAASPAGIADTVLKRLPAGPGELTFRGESASRSMTVQLGRSEAARAATFQLALVNAVSLLPERSILKLTVNGTVLAAVQAGSTDKATLHAIRIPPGLLVPGSNTVRITAALSHRVDCSVQATYELWAMLDGAQTGFLVPRDAVAPIRSLDDLALEPLAADGTSRIHLRMRDDSDTADLTEAAGVIQAMARRAGLLRPIVDVGPDRGTGAGFDIVISGAEGLEKAAEGLTVTGRSSTVVIGRDEATNRLVVVVAGGSEVGAQAGPPSRNPIAVGRPSIKQGLRASFAELGLPTEVFAGRHYTSAIDLTLPPDFLASNDRARLLLDGSHSGSLVEGSGLVFRVNGTLVSSMPLAAGKAEHFQHAIVELPLRFFHPGHNELSIEGTTSATADAQCDTIAMSREPRLTIGGSSELDFPSFAHLATLPQIPAAMAFDAGAVTHLYLPATDRASLGAGLTVLANMAVTQERIGTPQLHSGMPADSDPPGIVVGATGDLPENLGAALSRIVSAAPVPPLTADVAAKAPEGADAPGPEAAQPDAATLGGPDAAAPAAPASPDSLLAVAQTLLRDRGFFFNGEQRDATLPVSADSLVVVAVAPQAGAAMIGGVTLPQVTRDPAHWLVVTAADRDTTQSALGALIGSGQWAALAGEAVGFEPKVGTLHVLQPRTVSYVLPDRLVLQDLRPILGGVMSDNIVLSIAAMVLLLALLGLSTHLLVRRMGVR